MASNGSIGSLLAAALIALLVMSFVLKVSWNYTMPELFSLPSISVLQAVALIVLFNTLFSVFRVNYSDVSKRETFSLPSLPYPKIPPWAQCKSGYREAVIPNGWCYPLPKY